MEALRAVGVRRSYGNQEVLKGVDLALASGSFEVLMGPSGCGKSTFLHIAAGLLSADGGTLEIGGENVIGMSDSAATIFRRRHIGVVYQDFNLLNEKTVRENIELPLRLDGRKADAGRVESLAERLGIAGKLGSRPEELSGGERQRVAIARALVAEPCIVLADEPTGNLDVQSARTICELLRELNGVERSAILMVTHDPVVAASAGKVHFLREGQIADSLAVRGDAAEISRKYLEIYR